MTEQMIKVPTGLRLVPTEPTAEMLRAVSDGANDRALADRRSKHVWDLMLDAAPAVAFGTEPFAWIADYAACGGGRSVFSAEQAARNTDAMCAKTPVYTIETLAAALAAIRTLEAKGYTYNGAEMWKPPLGTAPDFNLIDDLRTRADDVDRLVRELDVLFNGEEGAAPQARLCDLVAQLTTEFGGQEKWKWERSVEGIVSDEELDRAYANADFGDMTKREVVRLGVLKCVSGWHQGHTSEMICRELGLISPQYRVTPKGRMYLWYASKGKGDV